MSLESIDNVNSLFEQPWYLEAVAPGAVKILTVEKGGSIYARLPVFIDKRYGKTVITKPPFTQTCGVWFEKNSEKLTGRLDMQKECIEALIDQLPAKVSVDLYLHHTCSYVLPWRWRGFRITPCFSYRLEDISDPDKCWANFRENTRRNIRKAEKSVAVRDDMDFNILVTMLSKTFSRQGRKNPINIEELRRLDEAAKAHQARKLLCAVDEAGNIHAAAYFVYDEKCCYYLFGGEDQEFRASAAPSLLLWEGIRFASTVSRSFDFEGSMIEDIERFFRAFGGNPQVYYRVTRFTKYHAALEAFKPGVKKLLKYK